MTRGIIICNLLLLPLLLFSQYSITIQQPEVAPAPFAKLVNVKGFYKDETNGWIEHQNGTSKIDEFKQYEIRNVKINNVSYFMIAKLCNDKMNFFVIDKSDLSKIKLEEDRVYCARIPIKYYGSVAYTNEKPTQSALEQELMNRIVFHDNLDEALQRFTFNFCVNTYYDYALRTVKFYTCMEQKSTVDEYVMLKNCSYRKSYSDIFVSPELFNQRYLAVDKEVFATFWQME